MYALGYFIIIVVNSNITSCVMVVVEFKSDTSIIRCMKRNNKNNAMQRRRMIRSFICL